MAMKLVSLSRGIGGFSALILGVSLNSCSQSNLPTPPSPSAPRDPIEIVTSDGNLELKLFVPSSPVRTTDNAYAESFVRNTGQLTVSYGVYCGHPPITMTLRGMDGSVYGFGPPIRLGCPITDERKDLNPGEMAIGFANFDGFALRDLTWMPLPPGVYELVASFAYSVGGEGHTISAAGSIAWKPNR